MAFAVSRVAAGLPAAGLRRAAAPAKQTRSGLRSRAPLPSRASSMVTKVAVAEVAQVASIAAEVSQGAAVSVACTLIGLAVGFLLLRVESLVEEGKL